MKKRNKIVYWISTLWLALGMLSTGAVQLLKAKEGQGGGDMLTHLGYPVYLLTLLGIGKLLGVIVLLVPRFPLLKEWAYAGFFFIMSGAIFSHIASGDPINEILPALLLLTLTLVSRYFRPADRKVNSLTAARANNEALAGDSPLTMA
ncbi:MAG TPA: DoxX family protein [Parafilimonas sp.]|nr:DoxX family protein [Parafilimonas sp.]